MIKYVEELGGQVTSLLGDKPKRRRKKSNKITKTDRKKAAKNGKVIISKRALSRLKNSKRRSPRKKRSFRRW